MRAPPDPKPLPSDLVDQIVHFGPLMRQSVTRADGKTAKPSRQWGELPSPDRGVTPARLTLVIG
jgi:hypothetical protein